jgi:hypothetical protein
LPQVNRRQTCGRRISARYGDRLARAQTAVPCATSARRACGCQSVAAECDGGTINGKSVGTNPNGIDRCSSGFRGWTNNDPLTRTFNRNCSGDCIGTEHDFTKYNPWRAPGLAPVYDSCGRAGGGPRPTGGKGEYVNTSFATFGQLGSTLPKQPSGAVWKAGSVVETLWNVRANQ